MIRVSMLAALVALVGTVKFTTAQTPAVRPARVFGYKVVRALPHDRRAFTQGLVYHNGFFYEGTGLKGRSSIRKVDVETGRVLALEPLPSEYFGEGIVIWKNSVIQLTWQHNVGFVYDLTTFRMLRSFPYSGEGWGLTHDGKRLLMSDGTSAIRFFNPDTLSETGRISVRDGGREVRQLNELEWFQTELLANVWMTDRVARIDIATGHVTGWIDLAGILPASERVADTDVLNGIAYDARGDRLFVTGKLWPKIFEIKLVPK